MLSKTIKYTVYLLILLLLVLGKTVVSAESGENAKGDILVDLRLYEGWRGDEPQTSTVVSTYYLKSLFVSNMVSVWDIDEEKKELKWIFNLADIRLMTRTQLGWKEGEQEKRFKMMVLNGHEFQVQLTMMGKKDDFKVEVLDKGRREQKPLLETDVSLPEKKSMVFGFEDSLRKPFFISLQREANQSVIDREPAPLPEGMGLKRIKYVSPQYPEAAIKNKIQGVVLLDTSIDREGRPVDIYVVGGPPELHQAAVEAVKQWRWEPVSINGTVKPVKVTMTVKFDLSGSDAEKPGVLDFYYENESLLNVLKYIAKNTDINIMTDPDVDLEARVSCQLDQTPWEKALDWMLRLHDLEMIYKGNVVRILKRKPANKNLEKTIKEKKYTGEPMDFNFQNAKLQDVLNIIARIHNMQMEIAPGIDGRVTVQMQKVPWDQFLDLVLELNGLDCEVKGNVYTIFKKKPAPKVPEKQKNLAVIPNIFPTKGYLTSGYGNRRNPLSDKTEFHGGIDISAKIGAEVVAAADGVVLKLEEKNQEYGKSMIIDHGSGYTTYYRELSEFKVKQGDRVGRGQVIGLVGDGGSRSTGPHLHYEVRFFDKPINPFSLIRMQ